MNFALFALNSSAIDKEKKIGITPGRIDSSIMPTEFRDGAEFHIRGEYAVVYSPMTLAHFGGKCCSITLVKNLKSPSKYPMPIIITDEYYKHLTPNAQKYVFCHEFGHLIRGHMNNLLNAVMNNEMISQPQRSFMEEVEADMNAVRLMGKENTLAAMAEMITVLTDVADVTEISERASYIKYNAI